MNLDPHTAKDSTMPVIEERFAIGSMNVPAAKGQGGDLSREKTRACLAAAPAQVGLLGTQETIEAEDNADINIVLPPKDWYHFAESSENDLMVKRNRWRPAPPARLANYGGIPGQGTKRLSKGLTGVTPHRDLTYVILERVDRPAWSPFVFANTHFVSGVYKGNDHLAFRQEARAEEMAGVIASVVGWLGHRLNVVLTLDSNWKTMPVLVAGWKWVVNDGIDKIGYANASGSNWALSFMDAERHPNASDHDFRVANMAATQQVVDPARPVDPAATKGIEDDVEAWLSRNAVSARGAIDLREIVRGR